MFTLARELRKGQTERNLKPMDIYLGRLYTSIESQRDWIDFLRVLNTR